MASLLFLHESPFEFLGVLSLCGFLKEKGHSVDVLIKAEEGKRFWDKAKEFKPDWVGLSSIAGLHQESYRLARQAKDKLSVGTIFGGAYASYYPECIKRDEVDVVIRGEAEEPLAEFLDAYDKGEDYSKIPNVWTKRNGEVTSNPVRPFETNLHKYPIPDRSYYYKYPYIRSSQYKYFLTGRGCPYNCYFCFNQEFRKLYNFKGHGVRRHSPERVMEELVRCREKHPLKRVCFIDNIFPIHHEWLAQFLPLYKKEIGVPYSCHVRANMVNEDVARMLGESGCHYVMIGLESGNPRVRREILGKKFTNDQFLQAADLLHKHGVKIKCYNLLGCPTETLEEALETVELNYRARVDYPWAAFYQPHPGTKTDAIARELGYLDKNYSVDQMQSSVFHHSFLNQPEIRQVARLQKLFYLGARNARFIPFMRKMVRYRLGPVYHLLFLVTYLIRYMRESGNSIFNILVVCIKHRKNY